MGSSVFYIAAAMAFIPTMIIMYVLLRKYTYPHTEHPYFNDPQFFILFAVGLIAGTILFLVYTYIMNSLVGVVLYALIQCLVLVVVMNLKMFRGVSDSIFYGFGFGLGAGCAGGTGFIFYIATATDSLGDSVDLAGYAFLFVMALAMIFQYSAVGINVGEGIARHNPMQFTVQAMISNLVFWIIVTIALFNSDSVFMYVMAVAALAISAFYLYFAYTREIAGLVRDVDEQNRKGRKKKSA